MTWPVSFNVVDSASLSVAVVLEEGGARLRAPLLPALRCLLQAAASTNHRCSQVSDLTIQMGTKVATSMAPTASDLRVSVVIPPQNETTSAVQHVRATVTQTRPKAGIPRLRRFGDGIGIWASSSCPPRPGDNCPQQFWTSSWRQANCAQPLYHARREGRLGKAALLSLPRNHAASCRGDGSYYADGRCRHDRLFNCRGGIQAWEADALRGIGVGTPSKRRPPLVTRANLSLGV